MNYRTTRTQLADLRGTAARGGGPTPEERIEALRDPNGQLDGTAEPPHVGGHTRSGVVETRAHVDEEVNEPHVSPRAAVRLATVKDRLRRAMGRQNFERREAMVPDLRRAFSHSDLVTDEEIIAVRGYTEDFGRAQFRIGQPWEEKAFMSSCAGGSMDSSRVTLIFPKTRRGA